MGGGVSGSLTGSGGASADAILRLLSDPTALQAKVEQLDKAEKKASAVIALVGPAEQIPALHEKASEAFRQASAKLEWAERESATILATARLDAQAAITEAESKATAAVEFEASVKLACEKALSDAKKILDDAEARRVQMETGLSARKVELDRALAEVSAKSQAMKIEREVLEAEKARIEAKFVTIQQIWSR